MYLVGNVHILMEVPPNTSSLLHMELRRQNTYTIFFLKSKRVINASITNKTTRLVNDNICLYLSNINSIHPMRRFKMFDNKLCLLLKITRTLTATKTVVNCRHVAREALWQWSIKIKASHVRIEAIYVVSTGGYAVIELGYNVKGLSIGRGIQFFCSRDRPCVKLNLELEWEKQSVSGSAMTIVMSFSIFGEEYLRSIHSCVAPPSWCFTTRYSYICNSTFRVLRTKCTVLWIT